MPAQTLVEPADSTYPKLTRNLDSMIHALKTLSDTNLVMERTNGLMAVNTMVWRTDRDTYIQHARSTNYVLLTPDHIGCAAAGIPAMAHIA